uniref:Uncharacterized protein n=1 Tax=Romanomermis culicivorax TaxID=13658 RepID=A0A915JE81_ROMCU
MMTIPLELTQLWVSLELVLMGKYELAILSWAKHLYNINALPFDKYIKFGKITATFSSLQFLCQELCSCHKQYHQCLGTAKCGGKKNENQSDLGLLETDKKSEMIAKDGMPFLSIENKRPPDPIRSC